MRNLIACAAVAMVFIVTTSPDGQAMTIAALAGTDAVVHETNIMHNVSIYYRPYRYVYGPYYDYAYRPFWKYRIPPAYYRCGC